MAVISMKQLLEAGCILVTRPGVGTEDGSYIFAERNGITLSTCKNRKNGGRSLSFCAEFGGRRRQYFVGTSRPRMPSVKKPQGAGCSRLPPVAGVNQFQTIRSRVETKD